MRYEIKGEPTPVVICQLSPGESMITERGSMVWMSPNMEMETSAGGLGKAFGRLFSGESIFQNIYTARDGQGLIAFASSFPGAIRAVEITPDHPVIVQKSAFLAAEQGVELSVFFQKKLGAGFFGGEGFIMQQLSGRGMAFLEIDGYGVEYDLGPGHRLPGDRRGRGGVRPGAGPADDRGHGQPGGHGRHLLHRYPERQGGQERHLRRRGPVQHRGHRPGADHSADHAHERLCGRYLPVPAL